MEYSPALSVISDMTEEELEKYFETYVPLSNLPTPPPAKEHAIPSAPHSASSSPFLPPTPDSFSPELQAQAIHLSNLVPSNISTRSTHCDVICGFLQRANLPEEIVAFAGCVLEMLSVKFAASWREELVHAEFERDLKNFLRTDETRHSHVSSNVVVLAALALAHGFCIDRQRSSRHWSVKESGGMFSVKEIEATKRAILRDTDYGLFRISDEMVMRMLGDMRPTKTATSLAREDSVSKQNRRRTLSINLSGTAMWSQGLQTPGPSP